ncbi:MAG: hypothetical protein AAGN35_22380 [Bacteroidota bacterium]
MVKALRNPSLLILLLVVSQIALAQTMVNQGRPEHAIVFGGFSQGKEVLHVNYEIPYPGVVTFALFDGDGERVWHKQTPLEPGPNRFSMRQAAFQADESYSFVLQYKLSKVSGPVPVR